MIAATAHQHRHGVRLRAQAAFLAAVTLAALRRQQRGRERMAERRAILAPDALPAAFSFVLAQRELAGTLLNFAHRAANGRHLPTSRIGAPAEEGIMSGRLNITVARFWCFFSSYLLDGRTRARLRNELHGLGREEEDRFFRECGLNRNEFATSIRNPLVSEDLLSPAMEFVGLDPASHRARHPSWNRDMTRVCMACSNRRRCRDDVSARRIGAFRGYCPNDRNFDEIAAMEQQSPA